MVTSPSFCHRLQPAGCPRTSHAPSCFRWLVVLLALLFFVPMLPGGLPGGLLGGLTSLLHAQSSGGTAMPDAPRRTPVAIGDLPRHEDGTIRVSGDNQGQGPFNRLIIRGVNLIDGTGSPMLGPVDLVIEQNRIVEIAVVGYPGVPVNERRRPQVKKGDAVLDATGMYAMPGFFDNHAHTGGLAQGTTPDYVYKLWLGHGITSIREPGSGNGLDWTLHHKRLSAQNQIVAPRITSYAFFGMEAEKPVTTPEAAREWVRMIDKKGADGIKFFGAHPDVYEAALSEAWKLGLRSMAHHAQTRVVYNNALTSARLGLNSMTHWYGLPEALFTDRRIQDYPADYNYQNEQHRFEQAGRLWTQAASPGTEHWNAVMNEMISQDFTLNPTFTIYEASRDLMRARTAEWHPTYTLPSLWDFFRPNRMAHGSYWFNWGTEQEVDWRENYRLWMAFVNEYKNRGGRVTLGSDAGYIYKIYGFSYIREMELFREAGFHPLEVLMSASLRGAEELGQAGELGTIEVGKLADIVLVDANPLANLQVLYGTGAIVVNEENKAVRVGGVSYTIKDGIVFDAKALLRDVEEQVRQAWEERGTTLAQPGVE